MADLEQLKDIAQSSPEISPAYEFAVKKGYPEGCELACPKCGAHRHANTQELAQICRRGFPLCRNCNVKVYVKEKPRA